MSKGVNPSMSIAVSCEPSILFFSLFYSHLDSNTGKSVEDSGISILSSKRSSVVETVSTVLKRLSRDL